MKPVIEVHDDAEATAHALAERFAAAARAALADHGRFAVALSGGSTPKRAYDLLGDAYLEEVPWQHVDVFWGDERCVAANDPRSNQRLARETFLDVVGLPEANLHPIVCDGDPDEAAAAYEADLRAYFGDAPRFDLVLLGLGDNGHTASLWPGSTVLDERERWAAPVHVADPDLWRVTLTYPVLNAAKAVCFLVTGAGKADAVNQVIEGPRDVARLPAQGIDPGAGRLRYLLDRAAAARLPEGS